ncbi:MAG: hypothetical protein LBI18_15490 [Planctomycetaceae bacterium]|jgi:hypothetical protein|nr:hypothetical protein [Planctomycetaceae bacterium]
MIEIAITPAVAEPLAVEQVVPESVVVSEEAETTLLINSPFIEELSNPYVGNWNTLVSQTNWEKGVLILNWRQAMIAAECPHGAYSDEAWARRVGNVSSQHVGRLRRVTERFGKKANDYPNLYWSHFQAALDWDDAELWLEGAVQNHWSVAQMRVQYWETVGAPEGQKPREEDIFTGEFEEEVFVRNETFAAERRVQEKDRTEPKISEIGAADIVEGFGSDNSPPFDISDEKPKKKESKKIKNKSIDENYSGISTGELLATTLKDFSDIPTDLAEAFETLKVAILNHKLAGWREVPPAKLTKLLETFKALIHSVETKESTNHENTENIS